MKQLDSNTSCLRRRLHGIIDFPQLFSTDAARVCAKISLVNGGSNLWNIKIMDLTNGNLFSQDFQYNSTCSSAEWIVERSLVNGQITRLADFGSVTFNDCTVQVGDQTGNVHDFTYSVVQMTNQQYERLATAFLLGADGASFSVKYDKKT